MAQTIAAGYVTPADELRDLLSLAENRLANVRGSGEGAVELLTSLDRIAVLWPQLEAQGMDLRPEAGRWATIQTIILRRANRVLAELRPLGGIARLRAEQPAAAAAAPWWQLDSYARERNRRATRRALITTAIVVAVGLAFFFLMRILFPVDPNVQASAQRVTAGEQIMRDEGDPALALAEFEAAAELTPEDAEVWLRVGALRDKLNDATAAQAAYDRARALLPAELDFFRARGAAFLTLNMIDRADADLKAALDVKNDDAASWYLLATVYESRQQITEAIGALDNASQYAEETQQTELTAMARYRMGMLMQQLNFAQPTGVATP